MFWTVAGGMVCIAIGILAFWKPDVIWELTEKWKSYSADEPSDWYLISTKFRGVLFLLVGIAGIVLPFVLE